MERYVCIVEFRKNLLGKKYSKGKIIYAQEYNSMRLSYKRNFQKTEGAESKTISNFSTFFSTFQGMDILEKRTFDDTIISNHSEIPLHNDFHILTSYENFNSHDSGSNVDSGSGDFGGGDFGGGGASSSW